MQHREIDATTSARLRDLRNRRDELAPDAELARRFLDENILDVEARSSFPGRVVGKKQREADRLAINFGDEDLEAARAAERIAADIGLGDVNIGDVFFFEDR